MPTAGSTPIVLLRACHPVPTLAVTAVTALLAYSAGHEPGTGLLVVAAVLTGQLSIGWSNDLLDLGRDRSVGRRDKPLVAATSTRVVAVATGAALVACVLLSALCGPGAAALHLGLVVGSGWAYNLLLKRTAWSGLPYLLAFGTLPAVVTQALPSPTWPAAWMLAGGAALGLAAHLLNVLPDLEQDAATGVRGLPHRLGAVAARRVAGVTLLAATLLVVLGPGAAAPWWAWAVLVLSPALVWVTLTGAGRAPFRAALLVALLDVAVLTLRAG